MLSVFNTPRILFVAAHRPQRSPSQRFRFEQYIDFLTAKGFECDFSYLISEKDDSIFYRPGNLRTKSRFFLKSWWTRLQDVVKARDYDIVFVQREAFMTGSAFFEKLFMKSGAKLVFDFDDAIWHFDISEANRKLGWLKNPRKTERIIRYADHVIAGNNYLANYALRFNQHVTVIPTTIDTEYHKPYALKNVNKSTVCIGWTGSMTTIKHFRLAETILLKLKEKYGNLIRFKLIGDGSYVNAELGIKGIPWTLESEVDELRDLDIGIMPLPEDEWSKGKCGFKGLQYMAMEIPPVMSPVGVNLEIIEDGVNGFLASGTEEWLLKLSLLIENPELRQELGAKARQTVIERYSVASQQDIYLSLFNKIIEEK
jgi:glycosyltransferase involved in cell wall biosynthesis